MGRGSGGKIRNWANTSAGETWINDRTSDRIQLLNTKRDQHPEKWVVQLKSSQKKQTYGKKVAAAMTKEGARQEAVEWMRNHPLAGRDQDYLTQRFDIGDKIKTSGGTVYTIENRKKDRVFVKEDSKFPPRDAFWSTEASLMDRGYTKL